MEAVSLRKFTSGRRDGRFALVECGRLEAEKMIRTLDANYLSTSPNTVFNTILLNTLQPF